MLNTLLPLITLIGGYVLGCFTLWVKWGIDKRKDRRKDRKKLIKEVRDYCVSNEELSTYKFINTVLYTRIKPFLSEQMIYEIENYNNQTLSFAMMAGTPKFDSPFDSILIELVNLEKKWKLI